MARKIDLLVVGGGPAGYSSAIRARQLGKTVVVAEGDALGGTCLNRGCIPTKALLDSAGFYHSLQSSQSRGIDLKITNFDYSQVINKKEEVVNSLVGGLEFLLNRRKIEVVKGEARFNSAQEVQVGEEVFQAEKIIVATGTAAVELPGLEPDGKLVLNSDQMLESETLPKSLLIVGGGVIGCEFATIFSSLGVDVTIVELTDQLLPPEDNEISRALNREFRKRRVQVLTGAAVEKLIRQEKQVIAEINHKGRPKQIEVERVLISVGRRPVIPAGFPGDVDERGYIKVNSSFRTTVPHIYGAGDVIGGMQLAHLAFEEGIAAASFAFGETVKAKWFVPSCVYTQPEIGSVGMTEAQAREKYGEIITAKYFLKGNGKAVIEGQDSGFIKIVASSDEVVRGVHIIGPQATELISNGAIVLEQGLTLSQWSEIVYPHPTVSEAIKEAVLSGLGKGLHSI